eukprot:CAMPEP_0194753796 /NCGR_PEP_ID=MMETSP0323_2-20130528/7766_1 /TAXON_ID=2866 ORGANISM="Crypthecodinium cohnii, Strain Seligo" /NCGR_SAMPLE_ID=MMETSP0323_2 /ASSEMBLY_ACC=CAM_ASM_000346 /LENGTH=242 /DNA_ID=CAMNT_0039671901 /DNA_START=129 /DNA_END=857 /DNA_ORIENTATION=+
MTGAGREVSDLHAALGKAVEGRRLLIIRHGNTSKAEVDADRELTEKGRLQCAKFREAYGSHFEGVKYMLVSVALRTRQTADLLAEGRELQQTAVEDLYFGRPWRTEEMRNADIEAGYRPIKDYIERYPGVHDPAGKAMAGALAEELPKLPPGDVAIVTHSGYMSFMALEVVDAIALCTSKSSEWHESARSVILEANVGEVSGFEVDDAGVKYLPNPEATDFAAASHNDAFVGPATTIPSAKH